MLMTPNREVIFISHAYPEDNVFAEWLGYRLQVAGYLPWVDLSNLTGGERIWPEAEAAIRDRAVRFLYVLSRTSNAKVGTLRELNVASKVGAKLGLSTFVIPVTIDDLLVPDYNIELAELAPISFASGWDIGLAALLTKLEKVGAPRPSSPAVVADAWRSRMAGLNNLRGIPERLFSNKFPVRNAPSSIYEFGVASADVAEQAAREAHLPAVHSGGRVYAFSREASEIHPLLSASRVRSCAVPADRPRAESPERAAYDAFIALMGRGWEVALQRRGLRPYEMANGRICMFFPDALAPERVTFSADGLQSWRSVTGRRRDAKWHFGITAIARHFSGRLCVSTASHVVFSDDGVHPWESSEAQHRARRGLARNWWNAKWRDTLLAAMAWLADGDEAIRVATGVEQSIEVERVPMLFEAPFSYVEDTTEPGAHECDLPLGDEDDDEYDDDRSAS